MNTPSIASRPLAVLAGLVLASVPTFAQRAATPPAAAAAPSARSEEVVKMSPFVVNTDKDTGFAVTSALAGGRLATDLKDTPIAYSVINRDLIDALNITDLNQAANWTTNSFQFWDGQGGGATFNITSPIAVRGISGNNPLRQRNFFPYYTTGDTFDVERFDFGRGPNQILFGNGTAGGTQITMTKRARLDQAFDAFSLSYGSWHTERVEVDTNHPVNDWMALRVAAVYGDGGGWRLNQMSHRKLVFATSTFKLSRNTELRLEGETGEIQQHIPYAQLQDQFGGWDGHTIYSGLLTASTSSNTYYAAGVDKRGSNYFVFNPFANGSEVMNYFNDPMTRGAGNQSVTNDGGYTFGSNASFNNSGASILHALNVPDRFANAIANSYFRIPTESFTNAANAPMLDQRSKDVQLTLTQRFTDSLYAEVAGDVNRVHAAINRVDGSLINTYIDINQKLPDGSTNPHFLQPYGDGNYQFSVKNTNAESVRAALAYVKDLGKWGNYSFNVMGGLTHQYIGTRYLSLMNPLTAGGSDMRVLANDAWAIKVRQYWNDPHPFTPPVRTMTYVDPNTGLSQQMTPVWALSATSFNNLNDLDNYYNYFLIAMNAKYLKDHLVILAAARHENSRQDILYTKNWGDYPTGWDGQTIYWRPPAPSNWSTLTYVPKNSAGVATGPAQPAATRPRTTNALGIPIGQAQYANDLFQDDFGPPEVIARKWTPSVGSVLHVTDWFGLSYNYSRAIAFNTSAAPDPYNNLLPPVVGSGWDAGFRLTFFNNRLNVAANQYSNTEFGNYIDPTSVTNQINNLYNFSPRVDANGNPITLVNQGNLRGGQPMSTVVRDTRTRIMDGYEVEIIANLSRAWRLTANVGLPKVWQKQFAPITRKYVAEHASLFQQILQDAGGVVGTNGVAVLNPDPTLRGVDAQNAVNAYNNIYNNLASFIPDLQAATTVPYNANLFTDYTFQTGKFKGLRGGIGFNWRGRRVVGYRTTDSMVDPNNPTKAIDDPTVDAHNVVTTPGTILWTATLNYTWKVQNKYLLSVDLIINNLFNNRGIVYTDNSVTARPLNNDYTSPARRNVPNAVSYQDPIAYTFKVSLRM